MRTLKDLLAEKRADPSFDAAYAANCSVCGTTVEIGAILHAKGVSCEDAAKRTGVPVERIIDLVNADTCDPEVVRKLCAEFGIPLPACSEEK